jgi:hypothetical protein
MRLVGSSPLLWLAPATVTAYNVEVLSCQEPPLSALAFCNASLPVEARVADLLPRLNLTEKLGQMNMVADAVPALGMIRYNFAGEALHGVWSSCLVDNVTTPVRNATGRTVCPTQFPAPVHIAASFNRDLWRDMAEASAVEARGLYNYDRLVNPPDGFGAPCGRSLEGCLGLSFYTPNINIARDPRFVMLNETEAGGGCGAYVLAQRRAVDDWADGLHLYSLALGHAHVCVRTARACVPHVSCSSPTCHT